VQFCIFDTVSNEFWCSDRGWNYEEVEVFGTFEEVTQHYQGEAGKRIGAEIVEIEVEYEDEVGESA